MDANHGTGTIIPTADDVAAYCHLCDQVAKIGAESMALAALRAGSGNRPLVLFMAAKGATIDQVIYQLRLLPGDLHEALHVPAAKPLPPQEATTFPDDDDSAPIEATGYGSRRLLAMLDVPRAAQLAAMVPGQRGAILFAAARGDYIFEVAELLGITPDAVDANIASGDGQRLPRP